MIKTYIYYNIWKYAVENSNTFAVEKCIFSLEGNANTCRGGAPSRAR
jgi:hypothetical protein